MIQPKKPKRYTISIFLGTSPGPPLEFIALDEINSTVEPGRSITSPSAGKVRWTCAAGDFEITGDVTIGRTAADDATDYKVLPNVPYGSTKTLKYTVTVYAPQGTVTEDPQIIIDDSSFP